MELESGKPPTPARDMSADLGRLSANLQPKPEKKTEQEGASAPQEAGPQEAGTKEGDDQTATEEAGQSVAEGGESSDSYSEQTETTKESNEASILATQDQVKAAEAVVDGTSFWAQLRSLVLGEHHYSWDHPGGSIGPGICNAGSCAGSSAEMKLKMNVNFLTRTFGGSGAGGPSTLAWVSPTISDFTSIFETSFAAFEGKAVVPLTIGNSSNLAFTAHPSGTSELEFRNKDGKIGPEVHAKVKYLGSGGVNVTGTGHAGAICSSSTCT